MVVVMKPGTAQSEIDRLVRQFETQGLQVGVTKGVDCSILGLVGDTTGVDINKISTNDSVERVMRVSEPYKRANRKFHPEDTVVRVGDVSIGAGSFAVMAGPCSVESEGQVVSVARDVKAAGARLLRGGAFKPRTSPYAFQGMGLEGLELLAPCRPTKLLAVGFNYRDHAEEFRHPIPEHPNIFLKPLSCLAGPGQGVLCPRELTGRVEYEAELVAVIGRRTRHVSREEAAGCILGYTVGNDVTARDLQSPAEQWSLCKGFDTFGPLGPWIDTEADPLAGLEISSFVNGQLRQRSNTRNLIFDPLFLVSYLSKAMTLEPGDVIFTGTPSGVGPVKPGDVMEMRIEGIGSLIHPVLAE